VTEAAGGATPVLELRDVRISYVTRAGEIAVVPGLNFVLHADEAVGLVGESGCGKFGGGPGHCALSRAGRSTAGRAGPARRLRHSAHGRPRAPPHPRPPDRHGLSGSRGESQSCHDGRSPTHGSPHDSRGPVLEPGARALQMLSEVDLADPESVLGRYPHQLSGGQQQRIVITMALVAEPALLIMDEPTTGLDVTIEAAVLDLIRALRRRHNSAILFITHNLGTVARVCDRVGVMYGGEPIEEGSIRQVFGDPRIRTDAPRRERRLRRLYLRHTLSAEDRFDLRRHAATRAPVGRRASDRLPYSTRGTDPPARRRCAPAPGALIAGSLNARGTRPPHPAGFRHCRIWVPLCPSLAVLSRICPGPGGNGKF
jgi:ABC-type dipeptide/oligopeptide/nickel transport system ATPase subunit